MRNNTLFLVLLLVVLVGCNSNQDKTPAKKEVKSEVVKTKETKSSSVVKELSYDGMLLVNGGTFSMGNNNGTPNEFPAHDVEVKSFYIDKNLVTVEQFAAFIKATGHRTEADHFGNSAVFDFETKQWNLLDNTNWKFPLGVAKQNAAPDHPVTHVSWNDATAYAKWAGKRLLTEEEWEFAATNGGLLKTRFPWGDQAKVNGSWKLNVFQGTLQQPEVEDGYLHTSPVGAFGAYGGLSDMVGNVWEWTSSTFKAYPGAKASIQENPLVKATRGGSFMYDQVGELSYTVTFRSSNTTESSLFNTGFRCAADVK